MHLRQKVAETSSEHNESCLFTSVFVFEALENSWGICLVGHYLANVLSRLLRAVRDRGN
jgi:hypothetical protein